MAGRIASERLTEVKAQCGHDVQVMIPPGELGTVGRQRIAEANSRPCYDCRQTTPAGPSPADIAKGVIGAREQDREFSVLRKKRDWDGQLAQCLDPTVARRYREAAKPLDEGVCSMCGEFCVFKIADDQAPAEA